MIGAPERQGLLELVTEARAAGCRKGTVCALLGISLRTIQNWEKNGLRDKRKGANKRVHNKLTAEEASAIIKTACNNRFKDLTPHEIVPILAEEGTYRGSVSSFYRVLRNAALLCTHKRKLPKRESIEVKAMGPDELWSWDITYLKRPARGLFYYLYMVMDIWCKFIIGWDVHEEESGDLAKALFKKIATQRKVEGVILHSDNGGPMISGTMQATLQKLGVVPSFSRPSVSNDNAYSESLFKTLKYHAGYPHCFKSIEEARRWVADFVHWYNYEHRHSRIGYVTPFQRFTGEDKTIFALRNQTFADARRRNPERWTKNQLIWSNLQEIILKKGNVQRKVS